MNKDTKCSTETILPWSLVVDPLGQSDLLYGVSLMIFAHKVFDVYDLRDWFDGTVAGHQEHFVKVYI